MFNDINKLTRTKNELEDLIRAYQTPIQKDMYLLKKLNIEDEAENILVTTDTIFIGNNRMQIKKLDGTIEKYNIEKYYPVDEKDEMIKELNKKVEELERRLNNEPTKHTSTTKKCDKSDVDDDEYVESEPSTTNESIQNEE